ncbi:MAG: hypothetical protein ABSF00_03560 [Candidatus Bathyarchaeia archaeon]
MSELRDNVCGGRTSEVFLIQNTATHPAKLDNDKVGRRRRQLERIERREYDAAACSQAVSMRPVGILRTRRRKPRLKRVSVPSLLMKA